MTRPIKSEGWTLTNKLTAAGIAVAMMLGLPGVFFGCRSTFATRKALVVSYEAKLPILFLKDIGSEEIKLTYRDKIVSNPYKIMGRLMNTGSVPIEERDIEEPVVLAFGKATVLKTSSDREIASDIKGEALHDTSSVRIVHKLLNPGDTVPFAVLCEGDPGWPLPTARISGVHRVRLDVPISRTVAPPSLREKVWLIFMLVIAVIVMIASTFIAYEKRRTKDATWKRDAFFAVIYVVAIIGLIAGIINAFYSSWRAYPQTNLTGSAPYK